MLLRRFSKLTCFSTLFLIFVGGMVTSTGSGLAVPDWPLSYGTLFPPMVGGVFYEHGHRMVAATVGFFMLCLAVLLKLKESRKWIRTLGYVALGAVILQGLLGGLTVLFYLPTPISVSHGVLAQTFFLLTIFIAYSQSLERKQREDQRPLSAHSHFLKLNLILIAVIYVQLIIAAVMRHTGSGLAIPDFPKMGGTWVPVFGTEMLARINDWRFDMNLDPVTINQVVVHFLHRVGAGIITIVALTLTKVCFDQHRENKKIMATLFWLDGLIVLQIILGMMTVLTIKAPNLTSLHVANGAAVLGVAVLLFLRSAPLRFNDLKTSLCAQ